MERNFKRVRRQVVSLLLVFAIVFSLMPLNALAEKEPTIEGAINEAINWILKEDNIEEWEALSISRAGKEVPREYLDGLKERIQEGEVDNVNDYTKVVLVASSLGMDGKDVFGHNFIEEIYNDEKYVGQFTASTVYALIALDSKDYTVPEDAKCTREKILDWLISIRNEDGGFGWQEGKPSDVDTTAMVLQVFSNYQDKEEVKESTEKALEFISSEQEKDGGFIAPWGEDTSESVSQTIIALTSLDIDPKTDKRFVKEGNLIDKLFTFKAEDGGFLHTYGQESNEFATEQALRALVAYDRFLEGKTKYFDMTDVKEVEVPKEPVFDDMDKVSKWAIPYVEKVKEYNLMKGVGNNLFVPKDGIKRGEFTALLIRLMEEEPVKDGKQVFSDVPTNKWYYGYVTKAYERGLMYGIGDKKFAPEEVITREEMAVTIFRLVNADGPYEKIDEKGIKDIEKASSWAKNAIYLVNQKGIMIGDNGNFNPKGKVTREMAATVVVRLAEEIK